MALLTSDFEELSFSVDGGLTHEYLRPLLLNSRYKVMESHTRLSSITLELEDPEAGQRLRWFTQDTTDSIMQHYDARVNKAINRRRDGRVAVDVKIRLAGQERSFNVSVASATVDSDFEQYLESVIHEKEPEYEPDQFYNMLFWPE